MNTKKSAGKNTSNGDYDPVNFFYYLYKIGWDKEMLRNVVAHKHLTQKGYKEITGEDYKKGEKNNAS